MIVITFGSKYYFLCGYQEECRAISLFSGIVTIVLTNRTLTCTMTMLQITSRHSISRPILARTDLFSTFKLIRAQRIHIDRLSIFKPIRVRRETIDQLSTFKLIRGQPSRCSIFRRTRSQVIHTDRLSISRLIRDRQKNIDPLSISRPIPGPRAINTDRRSISRRSSEPYQPSFDFQANPTSGMEGGKRGRRIKNRKTTSRRRISKRKVSAKRKTRRRR